MLQKIQGRIAIDRFEEIFQKYSFLAELLEKNDFWHHDILIWCIFIPNWYIFEPIWMGIFLDQILHSIIYR